jgi:hypothetical protein
VLLRKAIDDIDNYFLTKTGFLYMLVFPTTCKHGVLVFRADRCLGLRLGSTFLGVNNLLVLVSRRDCST